MPIAQRGKAPLERTIAREIRNLALTCTFVTSYLGLIRERLGVAGRGFADEIACPPYLLSLHLNLFVCPNSECPNSRYSRFESS
jgi:hypothetical protein